MLRAVLSISNVCVCGTDLTNRVGLLRDHRSAGLKGAAGERLCRLDCRGRYRKRRCDLAIVLVCIYSRERRTPCAGTSHDGDQLRDCW